MPLGTDDVRLGVLHALAAVFVFSAVNALVKWLAARYSVIEIVFFRNAFALVPAIMLVMAHGGLASLRTNRPIAHLTRGLTGIISMILFFLAFALLPLADATAIGFAAPLFLTALAVPMLGETVGWRRWTAVVIGFVGVLVMVRPGGDLLQLGALAALGAALSQALAMIQVRQMTRTENSVAILVYLSLLATVISGLALPFFWTMPTLLDFGLLAVVELAGGVAQYWLTQAYRYAPASLVSPLNYGGIVWATLLGFLIWNDAPDVQVLIGAGIVILSGVYIVHRETRRRVAVVKAVPPAL